MFRKLRSKSGSVEAIVVGGFCLILLVMSAVKGQMSKQAEKIKEAHNAPITVDK